MYGNIVQSTAGDNTKTGLSSSTVIPQLWYGTLVLSQLLTVLQPVKCKLLIRSIAILVRCTSTNASAASLQPITSPSYRFTAVVTIRTGTRTAFTPVYRYCK
jgi:hypothetical protein